MTRLSLFIVATVACAQSAAFEVASIKVSPPYDPNLGRIVGSKGGPGSNDPGLYQCENCSLSWLVDTAYDIPYYRLVALDWMSNTAFIVSAKIPEGATKQFQQMMQQLLADRFKLSVHRDQKEMPLYELQVAKGGPKLKESPKDPKRASEEDDRKVVTEPMKLAPDGYPALSRGTTMAFMNDRARVMQTDQTMTWLAGFLSAQLHSPVNDVTGLTGHYDFSFYWDAGAGRRRSSPSGSTPLEGVSDADAGPTLEAAILSQLGLKLEKTKGPVDIVVVDHAEKVPTEN
jgi:uncharacterized protein (TIGR03435 family)